jgi:5'-methylthioadenosine phosphorylase
MEKIGIIGGSGLDDPDILQDTQLVAVETPYGPPSEALVCGQIAGQDVVILARHGKKHQLSPSQVNYRANIHALKEQGVTHILATSACGSLKEEIGRGDFIIVDQFIDFTKQRASTFFESFEAGPRHTSLADPFDADLRKLLYKAGQDLGLKVHDGGTMISIEGPRFSTRAESKMFRMMGGDVINMSTATEATLAKEAGIPYGVVAMSTDYDCWKEDEAPVSWDDILAVFHENVDNVIQLLLKAVPQINGGGPDEN